MAENRVLLKPYQGKKGKKAKAEMKDKAESRN
jgi:hypothetical protein